MRNRSVSQDPYDGWEPDGYDSDCSTLQSDGHLQPSSDEDMEFDEDGNFRFIKDVLSMVVGLIFRILATQSRKMSI